MGWSPIYRPSCAEALEKEWLTINSLASLRRPPGPPARASLLFRDSEPLSQRLSQRPPEFPGPPGSSRPDEGLNCSSTDLQRLWDAHHTTNRQGLPFFGDPCLSCSHLSNIPSLLSEKVKKKKKGKAQALRVFACAV